MRDRLMHDGGEGTTHLSNDPRTKRDPYLVDATKSESPRGCRLSEDSNSTYLASAAIDPRQHAQHHSIAQELTLLYVKFEAGLSIPVHKRNYVQETVAHFLGYFYGQFLRDRPSELYE